MGKLAAQIQKRAVQGANFAITNGSSLVKDALDRGGENSRE
jgi:hypothetical protein